MMIHVKRCAVAVVLVAGLAGFIKQIEANEYELALTQLDNWLVNRPNRPKNDTWFDDLGFIKGIAKSRKFRNGKLSALRDQRVKDLVNLLPKFITPRTVRCSEEFWPILRNLNPMIQRSDGTACADSGNECPLRQLLKFHWRELNRCYKELFFKHFSSVLITALKDGSKSELGSLSGREIQNLFDEMGRQRWLKHLFVYDSDGDLDGALEARSRLRRGENPFCAEGLLHGIGETIQPGIPYDMVYEDEKTGAYVDLELTKADVMDFFEKNMKKPCESYVRATRPLVEPVAQLLEREGSAVDRFIGWNVVYWYLVCDVVVEMKFTAEMANAVVKELEKRHSKP